MWTLSGFADEIAEDFEAQLRHVTALGLRFIELRSAWGTNVLDLDEGQLERAEQLLRDHGIGVSSIGSPIGKIGIDEDFGPHIDRARRALDLARRFGARYVRIFSFFIPEGTDPQEMREEVLYRMRELTRLAEGADVVLLHENEKGIFGDIPERCAEILGEVASPHLRAAWDAANFVQVGVQPQTRAYPLLRSYIDYVQIKDATAADGEVVPAGRGDGEVPETIRALRDSGFEGFFSLEPHLSQAHHLGGFSGPELFTEAFDAFTEVLREHGIDFR